MVELSLELRAVWLLSPNHRPATGSQQQKGGLKLPSWARSCPPRAESDLQGLTHLPPSENLGERTPMLEPSRLYYG